MTQASMTTHPYAPRPLLLQLTSALSASTALVAALAHAYTFAAWLAVSGLLPFRAKEWQRRLGFGVALGTLGWVSLVVVLGDAAHALGGPGYAFVLGGTSAALHAWALARESARRYASLRFQVGEHAALHAPPAAELLERALRASPDDTEPMQAAIVALAVMPESELGQAEDARRAFWINAYNLLARHASLGRRSTWPDDILETYRTRYSVAGRRLSLNTIEHGLLRGNRPLPGLPFRPLRAGDPRLRWGVPLDPRVHFALNCGARSCPPIRVYHEDKLDAELALAQLSFLSAETEVDPSGQRLTTTALLRMYAGDFGVAGEYLAKVLDRPELRGAEVCYRRYDWGAIDDSARQGESR